MPDLKTLLLSDAVVSKAWSEEARQAAAEARRAGSVGSNPGRAATFRGQGKPGSKAAAQRASLHANWRSGNASDYSRLGRGHQYERNDLHREAAEANTQAASAWRAAGNETNALQHDAAADYHRSMVER